MSSAEPNPSFKISNPTEGPKLSAAQLKFMKLVESEHLERVAKLKTIRQRNLITGWALGGIVLSIYGYSIYAVKQEDFLDDFVEPPKVIDPPKK